MAAHTSTTSSQCRNRHKKLVKLEPLVQAKEVSNVQTKHREALISFDYCV